ncbi:hypothetical protein N431DRAFT_470893 [Stipitochalara longipes BDJ]|nr:hypothetical protein N431DRAFT_470893 [Stipitochalara longipes BDJ]
MPAARTERLACKLQQLHQSHPQRSPDDVGFPNPHTAAGRLTMIRAGPSDSILFSPAHPSSLINAHGCCCSDVLRSSQFGGPCRCLVGWPVACLVVIRAAVTSQCRGQKSTRKDDAGCLPVQSVQQQASRLEKTDLTKPAAAFYLLAAVLAARVW